jgi:hypothetical protein
MVILMVTDDDHDDDDYATCGWPRFLLRLSTKQKQHWKPPPFTPGSIGEEYIGTVTRGCL